MGFSVDAYGVALAVMPQGVEHRDGQQVGARRAASPSP